MLKKLLFSSNNSQIGSKAGLNLEGNPLSCNCENLCIFKLLQDMNKTFVCTKLHNTTENVDFFYLKHFEYSCNTGLVIATFSADAFLSIIVIGLSIPFITKERRRLKLKRLKESGLEQYNNARKKYVVFLSFAGDDEEFVMTHVYPQLEAELKRILNTESDCVATGGAHFRPGYAIPEDHWSCKRSPDILTLVKHKTYKTWKIYGKEMTLTFNTHITS